MAPCASATSLPGRCWTSPPGPAAALGPLRAEPSLLDRAARGEAIDELRHPLRWRAPGERRDYVATVRPVQAEDIDLGGLVILRDATQQREIDDHIKALNADLANSLEERTDALRVAEDANRVKMKFLEAVSHELRTPLTPILGFTRLLMRRPTPGTRRRRIRRPSSSSTTTPTGCCGSWTACSISRPSSGTTCPWISRPRRCPRCLADVAQDGAVGAGRVPVQVVVEIAERTPELLVCDGRRLGQILHRLVQNAVAHTHRGEIRIFARWAAGRLTVGVRDTGSGIAPEHQARIFLAFYQVDPGTGPAHGVGLGLAYAQLLANAMGGSIHVKSELGRGAEFTLDLPATQVEVDGDAGWSGRGRRNDPTAGLIYVVDDEPSIRRYLEAALHALDCDVALFGEASTCVEAVKKVRPDVVIMDWLMPGLSQGRPWRRCGRRGGAARGLLGAGRARRARAHARREARRPACPNPARSTTSRPGSDAGSLSLHARRRPGRRRRARGVGDVSAHRPGAAPGVIAHARGGWDEAAGGGAWPRPNSPGCAGRATLFTTLGADAAGQAARRSSKRWASRCTPRSCPSNAGHHADRSRRASEPSW